MEGCKNCTFDNRCPVLNRVECPFNKLWAWAEQYTKEAEATIAEAERFLVETSKK